VSDEHERIKSSPGWKLFQEIHRGSGAEERLVEFFKDFPGMLTYEAEFAYDMWTRPGLDLKARSMITLAALAALGTNPQQLQTHINAALNCGCTRDEIRELMMHLVVYLGFPRAMAGMYCAKEVFAARDKRGETDQVK